MSGMATTLTGRQIADAGLTGWIHLGDGLRTRFVTGDFATGLALVDSVAAAAEAAGHHPDLDLRYGYVDVRLVSHDAGGTTQRDVDLARTITALAADAGLAPDGAGLTRFELVLDSPDHAPLLPFWQAFLGYRGGPEGDDLEDPEARVPDVWFQPSGDEEPRQRWHLDVWLDPDAVPARLEAALAAGGTLVDDSSAPAYWVLADAEGNRSCLCTWHGRADG